MELFNSDLERNITFVRPPYFIISGFTGIPNMKYYYVILFIVYIVSVLGNTAVMVIICLDHTLRTPNYVAVFNLAFADLFGSSAVVPKPFNLVALSYDRLIAIIFPLHYQVKVTHKFMFSLIAVSWLFVITVTLISVDLLTRLSYCESVVINSYFCDYDFIQDLACNDNALNVVTDHLISVLTLWLPLLFILCCYSHIGYTVLAAVRERVKAFKTCTSHLSLVAIYFLPVMFTFALNEYIDANTRLINMCLTTVFPPMLNPIIYVLQTQEIQVSVKRLLKIKKQSKTPVKCKI
uniref:G-protein coupled receptors family 1 profile domain-containing protein n=1 Tax=Monopterus albus TaxID=43700 RepID=A0A3Q3QLD8_MONAL